MNYNNTGEFDDKMDDIPLDEVDPPELPPEEYETPKKPNEIKITLISLLAITAIISLAAFFSLRSKIRPTITDKLPVEWQDASVDLVATELNDQVRKLLDDFASNLNTSVDPCDDFYQFACGSFAQKHPVPQGHKEVTYLTLEYDLMKRQIMDHLDQPNLLLSKVKPFKHIKNIWDSCTKGSPDDAGQMAQLTNYLNQIEDIKSIPGHDQLRSRFVRLIQDGFQALFSIKTVDNGKGTQKFASIDRANFPFAKFDDSNGSLVEFYTEIVKISKNYDIDDIESAKLAAEVIEFERWLESNGSSDAEKMQSTFPQEIEAENLNEISGANWSDFLKELINGDYPSSKKVVLPDLKYMKNYGKVAQSKSEHFLVDYFKISMVLQSCFSIWKCREMQFKLLASHYKNQNESDFVRANCFNFLQLHFDDVLATIYHLLIDIDRSEAWQVVHQVADEFEGAINELSWMDDKTRTEAQTKIKTRVNLDLPTVSRDDLVLEGAYSSEPNINSTKRLDMFTYLRGTIRHRKLKELALLTQMSTPMIKFPLLSPAPVFHQFQRLHLPDFLRQGHFFDVSHPIYLKFGSLGSLVAHEITHSFDALANEFEEHQRTRSYWTSETKNNFNSKMKCLVQAYEGQKIEINGRSFSHQINGMSTLNENLADLFGLSVAYGRFKNASPKNTNLNTSSYPDGLKNFTEEQMFFLSFANVHCSSDAGQAKADLAIGRNPPRKFRVNVPLAQMTQFADAFSCKVDSTMNPAQKCSFK